MTSYLKSVREWATPTLKSSAFLSRGVLTPEEFVAAGDELVYKCPTWSWEGGDPKKAKSYLPPDKQVSFVGPFFGSAFVEALSCVLQCYFTILCKRILMTHVSLHACTIRA